MQPFVHNELIDFGFIPECNIYTSMHVLNEMWKKNNVIIWKYFGIIYKLNQK